MSRIVTLITDFGLKDEYVGVMKGVILGRAPEARIIDISHAIERHNIFQAGLILKSAYPFFPKGTIHLIVVDPEVGSDRRLVLLKVDGHLFLAPDNGVLGFVSEAGNFEAAFEVQCEQFYLSPVSNTFHGRDILAPVAAQLATGFDPVGIGPEIRRNSLFELETAGPITDRSRGKITGQVIAVDNFGNLLSNIREENLEDIQVDHSARVEIMVKGKTIIGLKRTYSQISQGELLAVIGSRGFLEIAVNQGSAASFLNAATGDSVVVEILKT